jgi:thiamine pyrophosphokinase
VSSFFQEMPLPVVAADGASEKLRELGVVPDVIIGDMDSVRVIELAKAVYLPDQNSCDFQKAIDYMRAHHMLPTIILGINGGFLDHILNNIAVFATAGDNIIYDPPIVGYMLSDHVHKVFELRKDTKISLIPLPEACITSSGLRWELNASKLTFFSNSCLFCSEQA